MALRVMFRPGTSFRTGIVLILNRLQMQKNRSTPSTRAGQRGVITMEPLMSKTYSQVIKQIETLKGEAEKLRRKEVDGVVARIREAISFYGLTSSDLGLGGAARAQPSAPKAAAKPLRRKTRRTMPAAPTAAKFRDEQGRTWGGRGKRPNWLREALAAGKTLNDFAVG